MSEFEHSFGDCVVESFVYDGRECLVTQHPKIGHYCGYARTPYQFSYTILQYPVSFIDVHGGLTYGVDDDGFIGFDCGHAGDECYKDGELVTEPSFLPGEKKNLWNLTDVKDEVRHLADQLTALERFVEAVTDE